MKALAPVLTFLFASLMTAMAYAGPIKSYNEWKSEKVAVAQQKWMQSRYDLRQAKTAKLKSLANKKMAQEQWNLEVARDLSVADYFVLYLAQQNDPRRYKEAAAKLSKAEVAALMEAYARSLGTQHMERAAQRLPVQAQTQSR